MFRGDPSDGLPGVKGIGEKGAALIANNFATVDEALKGAKAGHDALTPNLAKKIIEGAEYLKIAPTLVHCAKDVAIPKMDISMPKRPDDLSEIYAMQAEHGLGASVDRLISALKW
jgi:5'-3' exonuclease